MGLWRVLLLNKKTSERGWIELQAKSRKQAISFVKIKTHGWFVVGAKEMK